VKTGRYRVRPGLFGRAVLQEEHSDPMYCYGFVDTSLREITWRDVKFARLDTIRFAKMKAENPKSVDSAK
jgi:hypothetical protein